MLGAFLSYVNIRKASEVPPENLLRIINGTALSLCDRELQTF